MKITCFSVGSVDFCDRHKSDWPSGWPRCTEATNKEPIGVLPKAVTAWLQSEEAERRLVASLHNIWKQSPALVFSDANEAWMSDEVLARAILSALRESE